MESFYFNKLYNHIYKIMLNLVNYTIKIIKL